MGFKIFPIGITPQGEKIPLVKWRTDASDNPEQHKQWVEIFRDRIKLWGLPTGQTNGLWALDIDVKDGANGFESLKQLGISELPTTAFQHTPSGGMHLFFKTQPDIQYPTSVDRNLKLDTRGDGGYVHLYQPNFTLPLIETPEWVWKIAHTKPAKSETVATEHALRLDPNLSINRFNESIQAIRNAGTGERNHTLNTHAYIVGQLVAGGAVDPKFAEDQLTQAALSIGLTPTETHKTIASGLKGGLVNPITHPFGDKPPEPVFKIPEAPQKAEAPQRWTPTFGTRHHLTDWSKLKKPQLFENWSNEDIILTSAIGGVGKTTLKLFEAICLALGETFLGFKCMKPGRTLFVIGEDSEQKIYAMLGQMCKQLGFFDVGKEHLLDMVLNNIIVKRAGDICLVAQDPKTRNFVPNRESLSKIYEAVDDLKPVQIIFDPIAMFWGPESGGNDMAMALAKCMQELQMYSDASIDMISHIGKDSHTKKDLSQFSGRGGTALANHSRIVRTLLKLNDEEYTEETGDKLLDGQSAIYCYVSKFSDGSPILDKPFVILRNRFVFERKDIVENTATGLVNNEKERIFNYIKFNSTEEKPLTLEIVGNYFFIQNPKIPKATVKAVISMLKVEGLVEELTHGNETVGKWLRIKT